MGWNITFRGALFNGIAEAALAEAEQAVQREVAEYAEYQWRMNMIDSFRHPSDPPVYESKANIAKRDADLVVSDGYPGSGVKYGPWLEGVGTRNETTPFKGYFALRRAAKSVAYKTDAIAQPIISKFTVVANAEV